MQNTITIINTHMKKYILVAAATLALASCSDDNYVDEPIEAKISATIESGISTRASETKWDQGDKIGITMLGRYVNLEYSTEAGNGIFTGNSMYFLNKQNTETIIAYYPFSGSEGTDPGTIDFTTTTEKQNPTEQAKFDFLYAKKENITGMNPSVKLDFSHKMSKLTFNFINGNEGTKVSKITSYTIEGLVLAGTFNTSTGICSPKNVASQDLEIDLTDITIQSGINVPSIIVCPQQPALNTLKMKIHDSENQDYVCELKFGVNGIEAGNNYIFNITVSKTGVTINPSITEWHDEPVVGTDAKSDD